MKKSVMLGAAAMAAAAIGLGSAGLRLDLAGRASGLSSAYTTAQVATVTDAWKAHGISSSSNPLLTGTGQIFAQAVTYNGMDYGLARLAGANVRFQEGSNGSHDNGETIDVFVLLKTLSNMAVAGESGSLSMSYTAANSGKATVSLTSKYYDPVVFVNVVTNNESDPVAVYPTSVSKSSVTFEMREPSGSGSYHASETVHYMVVEAGTYAYGGNVLVAANKSLSTPATGSRFKDVALGATYPNGYTLLTSIGSRSNNTGYGGVRVKKSSDYFQARFMRKPDSSADSGNIAVLTYGTGTALAEETPTGCERCSTSCNPTKAYGYKDPVVTNALKGDLLFHEEHDGALRELFDALGQTYAHSAIFVDDGENIRHATMDTDAIEAEMKSDTEIAWDNVGGDCSGDAWMNVEGMEDALPGTCTMNAQGSSCDGYAFEWDTSTWMMLPSWYAGRGKVKLVADSMVNADFFYRFFAFRNYDFECSLTSSQSTDREQTVCSTQSASSWDGSRSECRNPGCMCSGTIAQSGSLAGITGFNTVHSYSKNTVAAATTALYYSMYDAALDKINSKNKASSLGASCKSTMAGAIANQVVNCFADFDCDNLQDEYVSEAGRLQLGWSSTFAFTAKSISPDDLIDNNMYSTAYWLLMSEPEPDEGGWGTWETGAGTCM